MGELRPRGKRFLEELTPALLEKPDLLFDNRPQFSKTAANPGLDGPEGLARLLGDFLLRQAIEKRHANRFALFSIELHHGAADAASQLGGSSLAGGVKAVDWLVDPGFGLEGIIQPSPALPGPELVDGAIPGHGSEPCGGLPPVMHIHPGLFPEGRENILHTVLGVFVAVEDLHCGSVDHSGKPVVEIIESPAITIGDGAQEFFHTGLVVCRDIVYRKGSRKGGHGV
jgi:hypothetical protein